MPEDITLGFSEEFPEDLAGYPVGAMARALGAIDRGAEPDPADEKKFRDWMQDQRIRVLEDSISNHEEAIESLQNELDRLRAERQGRQDRGIAAVIDSVHEDLQNAQERASKSDIVFGEGKTELDRMEESQEASVEGQQEQEFKRMTNPAVSELPLSHD